MAFKYTVIRVGNNELPIIFPDCLIHSLIADSFKRYFNKEADEISGPMRQYRVVSAGSVELDPTFCYGKSETLKLESRGVMDTELIEMFPYLHGIVEEEK